MDPISLFVMDSAIIATAGSSMKLRACSWEMMKLCNSCRNDWSPRQILSRNSSRSLGSRSRADSRRGLIFCQRSGLITFVRLFPDQFDSDTESSTFAELVIEPSLGGAPLTLDRSRRETKNFCRFLDAQST